MTVVSNWNLPFCQFLSLGLQYSDFFNIKMELKNLLRSNIYDYKYIYCIYIYLKPLCQIVCQIFDSKLANYKMYLQSANFKHEWSGLMLFSSIPLDLKRCFNVSNSTTYNVVSLYLKCLLMLPYKARIEVWESSEAGAVLLLTTFIPSQYPVYINHWFKQCATHTMLSNK